MLRIYHSAITTQALNGFFSPYALEMIIAANLGQDHWLRGQIGHPEYHFDQNTFAESTAYIERNRLLIHPAVLAGDAIAAGQAFGRLTHAAQDFYAHSNYVKLWLERFQEGKWPAPEEMDPLDEDLLHAPELCSGKVYLLLELLAWVPGLAPLIAPFQPRNSHASMNLDSPARGPMFAYAFTAAVKRTHYEFEKTINGFTPEQLISFLS